MQNIQKHWVIIVILTSVLCFMSIIYNVYTYKTKEKEINELQSQIKVLKNEMEEKDGKIQELKEAITSESEPKPIEQPKEEKNNMIIYDISGKDEFNGLTFSMDKVIVSKDDKRIDKTGKEVYLSGIKFHIENNNNHMISTYPTQSKIITSSGFQGEADIFESTNFDGEIYEGVKKDGVVVFQIPANVDLSKETWIKLVWRSHDEKNKNDYSDDGHKEHEVKIELKK